MDSESKAPEAGAMQARIKAALAFLFGSKKRQRISLSLMIACLILFAYAIWPTPYKYLEMTRGESRYPARVHRLTGTTEILSTYSGWRAIEGRSKSLPAAAVDKIELCTLYVDNISWFHAEVYNGSEYHVDSIFLEVLEPSEDDSRGTRRYKLNGDIPPFSTRTLIEQTDMVLQEGQSWSIEDAEGYKP